MRVQIRYIEHEDLYGKWDLWLFAHEDITDILHHDWIHQDTFYVIEMPEAYSWHPPENGYGWRLSLNSAPGVLMDANDIRIESRLGYNGRLTYLEKTSSSR